MSNKSFQSKRWFAITETVPGKDGNERVIVLAVKERMPRERIRDKRPVPQV